MATEAMKCSSLINLSASTMAIQIGRFLFPIRQFEFLSLETDSTVTLRLGEELLWFAKMYHHGRGLRVV